MDSIKLLLKWIGQGSIILGGVLSIYWFQFTEEGKKFWRTKMKNINMQELNEEEKQVHSSKLNAIKNGSLLLKLWITLYIIFFITLILMILI